MRHLALAAVYVVVAVLLLPGAPLAAEEEPARADPPAGSDQPAPPADQSKPPPSTGSAPSAGESAPAAAEQPAPLPAEAAPAEQTPAAPAAPQQPTTTKAAPASSGERWEQQPVARTAASQTVSMRDFSFAPATVSVNVGDTVTWRNDGKIDHTATANDGSFDTGNLASGQSGSATFEKAGSFAYICTIHPNMKGTVRVAAAGGGGSGGGSDSSGQSDSSGSVGSGGGGSSGSAGASDNSSSGESLPNTGGYAGRLAGVGLLLLALGAAARLVERHRAAG